MDEPAAGWRRRRAAVGTDRGRIERRASGVRVQWETVAERTGRGPSAENGVCWWEPASTQEGMGKQMEGGDLDGSESARLLLEEGRYEDPKDLGKPRGEPPARANRYWTLGNARRLWSAVLRCISDEGGVPKGSPAGALCEAAIRRDAWNGRGATLVHQVALRCTGIPGMEALGRDEEAHEAAEALMAHHRKGEGRTTGGGR